jgi:hypothetical protein
VFGLKNPFSKSNPVAPAPEKTVTKAVAMDDGIPTFSAAARSAMWENFFSTYLNFNQSQTANWQSLRGFQTLMNWFTSNPVFFAVVMILAREAGNMKYRIVNKDNGEAEPENSKDSTVRATYTRLNYPNVLQNRHEYLMQKQIFFQVLGNTMQYANAPVGFNKGTLNVEYIKAMWNVWPQYMNFKLAGNYFDATKMSDIISSWQFEYNNYKRNFNPDEILFSNNANVDLKDGLIFGRPIAQALIKPLTNIDLAYESRNVMMKNRGMRVVVSSNKQDESGPITMLPNEKKSVQDSINEYGMLEGQKQFFFSEFPLNVTAIEQDVRKLGLLDEVAADAMLVCAGFGVPEILLKLYLSGATFENQQESLKRLYQGTIIPQSENEIISLNRFFGLEETKWQIQGTFDHIAGLQRSEKDKASANREISGYYKDLFLAGAVTHNQWLTAIGEKTYPGGDKRIFELDDRSITIILNKFTISPDNSQQPQTGSQQEQPKPKYLNGIPVMSFGFNN